MADKKISALTGATTPLAGTEVLPIVQSGSTVKVSVANLTDGRAVTATSLAATDFVNATNSVKAGSGSNEVILQPKSILFYNTGAGDALIKSADDSSTFTSIALNKTQVKLYTANTERLNIGSTGDVTVSTGNLVMSTAGKGIDFSAATHAAGMTSELLNDYEEGVWTPTQGANLTVVGDFSSSGTYTKVGRLVMVRGVLSATTSLAYASTAAVICGGLPFSSAASCLGLAFNQGFNTTSTVVADTGTNVVAVTAMPATPQIIFTATYYV